MNSKRPRLVVLCVELASVRAITAAFHQTHDIAWACDANGAVALAIQEPAPIAVLVDNSVPQVPALEILKSVQDSCASARRILISDYCDLSLIVQGLHTGAVERIVYKPIEARELAAALGFPANMPHTARASSPARAAG
jgi:DNA-binding NarL/FixJ family response regulator